MRASSEEPQHGIERAFSASSRSGWRAAETGPQVIDVHFRQPYDLTRIRLVFEEHLEERTQQFTIVWSAGRGERHGELVRQQFNFSPSGAVREVEEYEVALPGVERLVIQITPDVGGREVRASMVECRLA